MPCYCRLKHEMSGNFGIEIRLFSENGVMHQNFLKSKESFQKKKFLKIVTFLQEDHSNKITKLTYFIN